MNSDTLFITYATDDNYTMQLGVSLYSLLRTNTEFDAIRVFVIDCGISEDNREKLACVADKFERDIVFLPIDQELQKDRLALKMGAHRISFASYARLFLASILPEEVERVLYLDCDTLVLSSLKKLWDTDLGSSLVAGVQDTVDRYFIKITGLEQHIRYINAGILLINLKAWRDEKLEDQFVSFVRAFGGNVPHHDQGTINGVCKERRIILPLKFNVMSNVYSFSAGTIRKIYFLDTYYSQEEEEKARNAPTVVHYTAGLFGRPWEENCSHPQKKSYMEILRQTPWKDVGLFPSSQKTSVKAFSFFYRHIPVSLFEACYRTFSWVLHLRR